MKTEEVIEEVEKSKVSFSKILLGTLFVLFTLIAVFFLATYIRWKAEISNKTEIVYTGQEEAIKIDKLVDFYGIELDPELKENEAISVYCTSEYGKECIMADYNNVLENNFRNPLLVISIIVLIDLVIVYVLVKGYIGGKKRTYVYGGLIILWGLISICVSVYKIADYVKLEKTGNEITGQLINYLRSNNKKSYVPYISYSTENPQNRAEIIDVKFFPLNYAIDGSFEEKEITLYQDKKNKTLVTPKRDMKRYILPISVGVLTVVMGFVYLTINPRFKKKEAKEAEKEKESKDKK